MLNTIRRFGSNLFAFLLGFVVRLGCAVPAFAQCEPVDPQWFSEENPGMAECPSGYVVQGMECRGRYGDDKKLYCVPYNQDSCQNPDSEIESTWSLYFSEERPHEEYSQQAFVTAVGCQGRSCDFVRVQYSEIPSLPNSVQCYWSERFSEETPLATTCSEGSHVAGLGRVII